MTTKAKYPLESRGGAKGHEWVRYFTPGDGHPAAPKQAKQPQAARGAGKLGPLGTNTNIANPANPPASVIAADVAVRAGGFPLVNPTVASGQATAPAASAVIADTGPLPAGTYLVEVRMSGSCVRTAGKQLEAQHRNAANAATVNILHTTPGEPAETETFRIVLAANERIRVVVGAVLFGAAEIANGLVRVYLLPI